MFPKQLIFFSHVPFGLKPCQNLFSWLLTFVENSLKPEESPENQHQIAFQGIAAKNNRFKNYSILSGFSIK